MDYKILEHATDAVVEVTADDMDGAFTAAGLATVDIMLDIDSVGSEHEWDIAASGDDLRHLLYDWLEAVIYRTITDGIAISSIYAKVERGPPYTVRGKMRGESINLKKHGFKVEIKAPTFHEMEIDESNGVRLKFLLDL